MSKVGVIYCITCTATGKQYIGQTRNSITRRINYHLSCCGRYKSTLQTAVMAYGRDCFSYEILETAPVEQLNALEIRYIRERNTLVPGGYNLLPGGNARSHHPETRKRLSIAHMGRSPSPEVRAKLSKASRGRKYSAEICAKNTQARYKQHLDKWAPVLAISEKTGRSWWFRSRSHAKCHGFKLSGISAAIRGVRKTYKKFKWLPWQM